MTRVSGDGKARIGAEMAERLERLGVVVDG